MRVEIHERFFDLITKHLLHDEKLQVKIRFIVILSKMCFDFFILYFWGVDCESEICLWRSASEILFFRDSSKKIGQEFSKIGEIGK